jgi:MFS family permease
MAANYGLLSGPAFSLSYAFAGIFMGLLVDKVNRKKLLLGSMFIWSMSTVISGTTNSFGVLFLMRFILGLFVSATEPAGYSLLGDFFPRKVRTTANSAIGIGGYMGGGLSSLQVVVIAAFGWRGAYLFNGGVGIAVAALGLILLREPEKGMLQKLE